MKHFDMIWHHAHTLCHLVYLIAVALEAHGFYGNAAGVLAGVVLIGAIKGMEA